MHKKVHAATSRGGTMKTRSLHGRYAKPVTSALVAVSCFAFSGFGSAKKPSAAPAPIPYAAVPKAVCGPGDHPEPDLQGQVSAATRAAGFKGYNCNLQLIAQSKGDGANWQTTEFRDGHSRICAYHGTAS